MESSSTGVSTNYKHFYDTLESTYQQLVSAADGSSSSSSLQPHIIAWGQSLYSVITSCFIDIHQNLMDDSGLSDQPFFIEFEAFFLSIVTDREFDPFHEGNVLQFIYFVEKKLAELVEGGRQIGFLLFHRHTKVYVDAPYLHFLRTMLVAYLKQSLAIPIYTFDEVGSNLAVLFQEESPSFTLLSDGYLTPTQHTRLQALATIGHPHGKVDHHQLSIKLKALMVQLVQSDYRCARYNEVSILDGMLQALLITLRPGALEVSPGAIVCTLDRVVDERCFGPDRDAASVMEITLPSLAVTGNNHVSDDQLVDAMTQYLNRVSTQLSAANVPSERSVVLVAFLAPFIAKYVGDQQTLTAFAMAVFMALALDVTPLEDRPQYTTCSMQRGIDTVVPSTALGVLFTAMTNASLLLAAHPGKSSSITHNTNALSDVFNGPLTAFLFAAQSPHGEVVRSTIATSPQLKAVWNVLASLAGCTLPSIVDLLTAAVPSSTNGAVGGDGDHQERVVANPVMEIPAHLESCPPAASLALVQWEDLPPIDDQILRVLLHSLGDNGETFTKARGTATTTTDATAATSAAATTTTTKEAPSTPEDDIPDEWDAEDDVPDAWDAEELDDWDAASDPEESTPPAGESSTTGDADVDATTTTTTMDEHDEPPTHPKLLGGPLRFNVDKLINYWETHQMVSDGATMQASQSEAAYRHNPIRLSRDTRFMLRKLLIESRDPKTRAYVMPPDEKIRQRVDVARNELTIEKAKQWFRTTIENLEIKADNQRIARSKSTKKEYNQSMITPSRIVLRDIVATEQEELSANGGNDSTSANNNNNNNNANNRKHQKQSGGTARQNVNRKETVQDRVARETQEKQAKQDYERVLSYIHTVKHLDLPRRIEELDKKLLAHADLPSALHGLMVLLEWRVEYWKYCVENRRTGGALLSSGQSLSSSSAMTEAHMEVAVRLYQLLADLSRRFLHIMTPKQVTELQKAYAMLGFFDNEIEVELRYTNAVGTTKYTNDEIRELVQTHLKKAKSTSERRFNVGLTRAKFLLQYAGHVLLRNVKSARDNRVSGFYPDKWQRQLLDIVDNNESAIVVAPTSAGKTLVSFYAVERVLRANKALRPNEKRGIVVFVAPTYPLARQMEADITNRNKDADVVVHDHMIRLNSMKFDVLITLPSCLENLMTSPYRSDWVSCIKYVVFDEVHSIGSTLNGPVWERLFLLSYQSPFLALSATVGGADHFHHWLMDMRQKHDIATSGVAKGCISVAGIPIQGVIPPSSKVHKVVTTVRWSHLHHYFYVPSAAFLDEAIQDARATHTNAVGLYLPSSTTSGGEPSSTSPTSSTGASATASFVPLHPVATLSLNKSAARGIHGIYNVEFSSGDVLQLYEAMQIVMARSPRFNPPAGRSLNPDDDNDRKVLLIQEKFSKLEPDSYFGFFVDKVHVLEYETQLKDILVLWHDAMLDTELLEVINMLADDIQRILQPLCVATRSRRDLWKKEFINLIFQIKQRDWFPALIFCLDRSLCTELAEILMKHLEEAEHEQWVKENNKRLDVKAREREIERQLRLLKKARDAKGKGSAEAAKEAEEEERMGIVDTSLPVNVKPYDPNDWNADPPDERFSFIKETETMGEDVKTYWENRLNRANRASMNGQHPLVRALFRGFGVHHLGVDKQYRDLVEILFRQRNLKFVISTEALGLGVNMPCRTAVLAFTTTQLNPLNYRQMSGRAGRRGFDDKGQVIFFGIDPYSACRLMTSSLTPLRGHFNLTCTTVLRSCIKHFFLRDNLANGVTSNVALADQHSFLTRSFYAFSEEYPEHIRVQLVHYFRFCLAYFSHFGLIMNDAPTGLAYLISTIASFTNSRGVNSESGAFMLGYLLRSGLIDKVCEDFDQHPEVVGENLMTILAHLFFPLRLRNGAVASDYPPLPPGTRGHVVLPSLTSREHPVMSEVEQAINTHDTFVLRLFSRYCLAVASSTEKLAEVSPAEANEQTAALAIDAKNVLSHASALPFSQRALITAGGDGNGNGNGDQHDLTSLTTSLHTTAMKPSVRSLFNALSHQGDTFDDALSLATTSRSDISLRIRQLPLNIERFEEGVVLSSYALDFYLNGEYSDMINIHGVASGEAWEVLLRFSKLLATLSKGLARLAVDDDDSSADDGTFDDDDGDEDVSDILKKSNLYQNNPAIRTKMTVPKEHKASHLRTAKAFAFVHKHYLKQFSSITRDSSD